MTVIKNINNNNNMFINRFIKYINNNSNNIIFINLVIISMR